jgi:hypothetical protein
MIARMRTTILLALLLALAPLARAGDVDHVVIVTIDGPRASECLDGDGRKNFAKLWGTIAPRGASSSTFENDGVTKTCPGHASILTGTRQQIPNDGSVPPTRPTIFERYRAATGAGPESCWFVASKGKISALRASSAPGFGEALGASVDAPALPLRPDAETADAAIRILREKRPAITMVALAAPDIYGHMGMFPEYVEAIRRADALVARLWTEIEFDPALGGRTALFVTSDHGRHLDEKGGFQDHGCDCAGCRRIPFFAIGAGIRPGVALAGGRQVDIAPTVARLLGFPMPEVEGRVLEEILAPPGTAPPAPGSERPARAGRAPELFCR